VPAGLAVVAIAARTRFEDPMLLDDLPRYAAYAQAVRHRLVPFAW
jgi:protein-S-isoprenylcysteine O-methyltransferase Ste14